MVRPHSLSAPSIEIPPSLCEANPVLIYVCSIPIYNTYHISKCDIYVRDDEDGPRGAEYHRHLALRVVGSHGLLRPQHSPGLSILFCLLL